MTPFFASSPCPARSSAVVTAAPRGATACLGGRPAHVDPLGHALKASGWSTRDVLAMKTWEALLLGTGASALGLGLAYGWAFWLGAPGLAPALAGWSTLYPTLALTPTLTLAQALLVTALTTLPFVALTIVPAYRAAALDPLRAMRQ